MKVSEITQQTNENWLDTAKSWMQGNKGSEESVLVLGYTGAIYHGFKQATNLAGIKKPTVEDLAEYLSQARIGSDPIRKAMFKHFKTGFDAPVEPDGDGDGVLDPKINYDEPTINRNKRDADAKAKADAEAGVDPNQQELFPKNKTEPTINLKPGVNPTQVIDRSGDKETLAQKIGRKIPKWPSKSKRQRPMATTGQTARSKKINKRNEDFIGKSLIAEAGKPIPDNIAKMVIQTALQHQSRIGGFGDLRIPANAQQPSINSKALFQLLKHEMVKGYDMDSEDPADVDNQHIKTIAGQIKAMSQDQREKLTRAISAPDTTSDEPFTDQPLVQPPETDTNSDTEGN